MKAIDRLKKTIRGVDKDKPVTQLQLSEIIRRLWSDQGKIIQIIYNEIINNTSNIYQSITNVFNEEITNNTTVINQSISQIIRTKQDENHESSLIEHTTNISETVISNWSVIPYNQQVGEFKAVVMVRNKVTNTIVTLMSLFSFDYSDATAAVIQNDLLTDAGMTLTLGVNGSNQLYATVSGMPADAKRIHVCFERCVLGARKANLAASGKFSINSSALLESIDLNLRAAAVLKLSSVAKMSMTGLFTKGNLGLYSESYLSKYGLFSTGSLLLNAKANLEVVYANIVYGLLYNFPAVTDSRKIAPPGWHVMTDTESAYLRDFNGWGYTRQGGNLKETGTDHWDSPNTNAYNLYGFNARGCGMRGNTIYSAFQNLKAMYNAWVIGSEHNAIWLQFNSGLFAVSNYSIDINNGCSVRLVKDSSILSHGQKGYCIGNDLKVYETIKIGDLEVLAHDLAETLFQNGDPINEVTLQTDWGADNDPKMCAYNNNWDNVLTI